MRGLLALFYYVFEGFKHVIAPTNSFFHEVILRKIDARQVPRSIRPALLGFVVLAGLRTKTYKMTLDAAKRHGEEIPWKTLDVSILRRVLELAIIFEEYSVARSVFLELRSRRESSATETEALRALMSWASGARNQSTLDLSRKYFVEYPEYDEWFKGKVAEETGRIAESAQHFRMCLELAPADATELRNDVTRRLADID